ncbi:16S rRNA (cytidine(1402)-2'-O)-methyltransferase [Afifella sp. IM 167]|uniref:16S rRNA (cytidine(1402)-2'-O)-methyltransferase n=1 Tax=Afifella sp. IM 167 TaxID=2033586 RepID=UPI001CCD0F08|nr:16S rRNA (cytidine(1402)-2'-O)-methyltransferase [Afifella sp. IM 167]MBZ8133543.1 16S rRNA (cytidine(1402)-2'-O)-methyltransferase [Afifella sp. IM 167]
MEDSTDAIYVIRGREMAAPALPAGLYVTATPIGNLGDITLRALETLAAADLIAAEDTRVTRKLLSRYGISTRLSAYHEHSGPEAEERLLAAMRGGASVALVSDAGTPLISDPGARLVARAAEAGLAVHPIPGPSSLTAALSAAGVGDGPFIFAGFLPPKSKARRDRLRDLATLPFTLVFLEAPHRLSNFIGDALDILGDRPSCLCRELTKLHEVFLRARLSEIAAAAGEHQKGEIVVVVSAPEASAKAEPDEAEISGMLSERLACMGVKDAAREVSEATGLSRRELYQRALALSKG